MAEAIFTGLRKVEGVNTRILLGSYEIHKNITVDVFEEALSDMREGKS